MFGASKTEGGQEIEGLLVCLCSYLVFVEQLGTKGIVPHGINRTELTKYSWIGLRVVDMPDNDYR